MVGTRLPGWMSLRDRRRIKLEREAVMLRKRWRECVGAVIMFLVTGLSRAASDAPAPVAPPAFLNTALPFGEKSCLVCPAYPADRMWRFQNTNDIEIHTTAQGVGDDSALVLYTRTGSPAGEILIYDMGVQGDTLKTFKGLTFWMRGDGGPGDLSIGCNWNQHAPTNPKVGRFPLAQRGWHKYFVPWNQFTPDVSQGGFWYLNLKLELAAPREAWALLARVAFYTNEATEAIAPPKVTDPAGAIAAATFVHPEPSAAGALLPKTLAKLRARQPVTIVAAGDSITAGAQLWYRDHVPVYVQVLEETLAAHYGYAQHRALLKKWQTVDSKSGRTASGATNDSFAIEEGTVQDAAGALAFDGLQVIGVGAGGKNTAFGQAHLGEVTMYHPDLVIWFYGGNDLPGNNRKDYVAYSRQAIEALRAQGTEFLLSRPTCFLDEPYYGFSQGFREPAEELASTCHVPWLDQFGAFNARGRRYVGDLLSDGVHPNEYGHEILAATMAAALGVPDSRIWMQPMFRARQPGQPISFP